MKQPFDKQVMYVYADSLEELEELVNEFQQKDWIITFGMNFVIAPGEPHPYIQMMEYDASRAIARETAKQLMELEEE